MPERHSHVVGGSTAARMINCPGSVELLAQLPEVTDIDTFYSREGTALHSAMEMLISGKISLDEIVGTEIETRSGPVVITVEHLHEALQPAMAYWNDFLMTVDDWLIEAEVDFPGIKGAFGTTDVLGRDHRDNITYVTDWKFGAGKGVLAEYGDVPNEQLMFYACAARNTYPDLFPEGCRVCLTIVQPRARDHDMITRTEVTLDDLTDFETGLQRALHQNYTNPGRWCDFQRCKAICSHHTGPLLDIAAEQSIPTLDRKAYMATLLRILKAAPVAEALIKEARAQAHLLLANGEEVPGWKLVAKRGLRQWAVDDDEIMAQLKLSREQIYQVSLRSPAQIEKLSRKKVPTALAPVVSSGSTIAPDADKRPAISGDPDEISKIMIEVFDKDD